MISFIVIFILSLDRFTKYLAVKHLFLRESFPVIKDIFHFTLVYNRGAAFGILRNQVPFFIVVTVGAIVLIVLHFKKSSLWERVALAMILAGSIGNLFDRIAFGYVIDFLDFRVWPVFNVADSSITVGAALLGYSLLRQKKKI
jgi:signal peptidase II